VNPIPPILIPCCRHYCKQYRGNEWQVIQIIGSFDGGLMMDTHSPCVLCIRRGKLLCRYYCGICRFRHHLIFRTHQDIFQLEHIDHCQYTVILRDISHLLFCIRPNLDRSSKAMGPSCFQPLLVSVAQIRTS
jgi:hypothetical protein